MTAPQLAVDDSPCLDPVGELLAEVAAELRVHCVVEDRLGRVVAHALRSDPPPAVVDAVLRRDARLLHTAAAARRTVRVLPGGPVQSLRVGRGAHAVVVPLVHGVDHLAWCWAVADHPVSAVDALVERVTGLTRRLAGIAGAEQDDDGLAALLAGGGALPSHLHGLALHVAVVHTVGGSATGVASALRRAEAESPAPGLALWATDTAEGADLLLAGAPDSVADTVSAWCRAAGRLLHVDLAAGLAGAVSAADALPRAHGQAAATVRVAARPGACVTVAAARSAVVLEHLGDALDRLPDLGRDPLQDLLDHDARRGSDLARSMLAWLDAHGEVQAAAAALHVHKNTLRYRVSRAVGVLGVDVDDPDVRLELHLRLRRWARSRPHRTAGQPASIECARRDSNP